MTIAGLGNDSIMAVSEAAHDVANARDLVLQPPSPVTRFAKLLERLLSGDADRAFAFDDVCTVLLRLGFTRRVRGSHHIFTRDGIRDIFSSHGAAVMPSRIRCDRSAMWSFVMGWRSSCHPPKEPTMKPELRYEVVLYWSEEDEAFIAEVPELAGGAADGASSGEALAAVEVVISQWIETATELGRPIPTPKGRLRFA